MTGRFAGKVAIVTGSSNGIGRDTAKMLAEEGAKVTITGRNSEALDETKSLCVSAGAKTDDILSIIGNIQEETICKKLVEETVNKFGQIDIVVNNAGSLAPDNTRTLGFDAGLDDFDYTMNLNLRSVLALTKLAYPYLQKTKGSVVMVSSIASGNPGTSFPYYAVSKAALDHLTRSMALAYIEKGVRVNCVNPGWTSTSIMQKLGMSKDQQYKFEAKMAADRQQIPMGRPGQPEEVARLICFLADPKQSEYIIGQCIIIDGGRSLVRPALTLQE